MEREHKSESDCYLRSRSVDYPGRCRTEVVHNEYNKGNGPYGGRLGPVGAFTDE